MSLQYCFCICSADSGCYGDPGCSGGSCPGLCPMCPGEPGGVERKRVAADLATLDGLLNAF